MIAPPKPPPHDELEALIKEARARQLRRRLLGAAGVAIAAAVGLGAYAVAIGGGSSPKAQRSPAGGAGVPSCRPSQLSASTVLQPAMMSGVGPATITNLGARSCSLPSGIPAVRITWRGTTLAVHEHVMRGRQGPPARLLRPGASAAVPMVWTNWCGRARGMLRLVFHLSFASGLAVRAPQRVTGQPVCNDASAPSTLSVGRPFRPH